MVGESFCLEGCYLYEYNYSKNTLISFYSPFTYELIENLPLPNAYHLGLNGGAFFSYLLEGTFNTQKQIDFLNDLVARFYLTFQAQKLEYVNTKIEIEKPYKAKELAQSDQLASLSNLENYTQRQNCDSHKDKTFWAIKLFAINYIKHNNILNYQALENFATQQFLDKKTSGKSTIRCKCRSIYNYYEKRNFEIEKTQYEKVNKTQQEIQMTRVENCKKMTKQVELDNIKKVKHFLSGMFIDDYKKPNGNWNISKISKEIRLSRNTIYKALKNN